MQLQLKVGLNRPWRPVLVVAGGTTSVELRNELGTHFFNSFQMSILIGMQISWPCNLSDFWNLQNARPQIASYFIDIRI